MKNKLLIALGMALAAPASAQIVHNGPAEAAIAQSVSVPTGARMLYVSGLTPDAVDAAAPEGPAKYGDTETQARSVFKKINAALAADGMGPGDVVMMRVYLVAPPGVTRMDFQGMMKAYREIYGTADQPNKPARLTLQIAGLANANYLVEIEVQAAKLPAPAPAKKK
jgi:enamine deaminase RidA (YjgF/YER057c/UK114 family)